MKKDEAPDTPPGADAEFWANLINSTMKLMIEPEIKRRQARGDLPVPAGIWAAQIIFEPEGSPPRIFLNSEIRGKLSVVVDARKFSAIPDRISFSDLEQITDVQLDPRDFPNSGHITLVFRQNAPFAAFSLLYNAQRITEHLEAAEGFLAAARAAAAHAGKQSGQQEP